MKIVFGGPPHSGKSVLLWEVKRKLPIGSYMPIRAAPDGEGDWTQLLYQGGASLATTLRQKGAFSPEFVTWASHAVEHCTARFGLIDIGGRPSEENEQICRYADALIIVSSQEEKIQEWKLFASSVGLQVLAVLYSSLDAPSEWWRRHPSFFEGMVIGLDRERFSGSTTIDAFIQFLEEIVPLERNEEKKMNTMTIQQLADLIGKEQEDYTLPNGRAVHGLNWRPEDLPLVAEKLKHFSALGSPWLIDGPSPQWLIVSLLEAFHPCPILLADSKVEGGQVAIGQRKVPEGGGRGELEFTVKQNSKGFVVHYYSQDPISAALLPDLVPPALPEAGRPVFLNGRTATWGVAEIASCYQHVVPAVYVGQPIDGAYTYVCAITHSSEHPLGSTILESDL